MIPWKGRNTKKVSETGFFFLHANNMENAGHCLVTIKPALDLGCTSVYTFTLPPEIIFISTLKYGATPPGRKLNFSIVSVHRLNANIDMTHFRSIISANKA